MQPMRSCPGTNSGPAPGNGRLPGASSNGPSDESLELMGGVIKLSSPATRDFWEIPILFEDVHLLALNKPSRLLTSPDRYDPDRPNLMRLLHRDIARGAVWSQQHGVTYLANAHRLDFETTGII